MIKLGSYIELVSGRDLTKSQYNDKKKGIPYIMGASNMIDGILNIERWTQEPTVIGKKDDLIISVKGTVGELLILEENEVHLSRQVMAIRSKSGYEFKFIFYYLKYYLDRLKEKAKGMIPGITREDILGAEFIEMNKDKQQKIIKILDSAQTLIDKRKDQIEELDELVKSRFIEMFGDPVSNPSGWNKCILQECCSKITDGTHDTPQRLSEGKLLITGKNIRRDKIDLTDIEYVSEEDHEIIYKRCNPEYGDVLYTNIGVNYGTAVINSLDYEFSMKNVALLKPDKSKINGIYLWHYLNLCRNFILEENKTGGAQTFMSLATIKKLNVVIPSLELQNQFAAFVKQVDKLKFEMQESLKELENNFNSLMQKAFNGELFS
ncbi:restriction endonuclease subunit S [Clostridium sp. MSJ-4]|uniref:Restriction endonuclease subunit S n=1 Tax=Clostridium simiarum TaxID=2841506 RepID=A0ABS6EYJ9_9CLOT|nr:restriction endonuclease subunit S [Clostridium simiarum]MBU5591300.1 restriction endonuclease subunit S [Clostridium simiarum]